MDVYWHLALIIVLVGFVLAIVDFFLHDDPKPPEEPLDIDWDELLKEIQR